MTLTQEIAFVLCVQTTVAQCKGYQVAVIIAEACAIANRLPNFGLTRIGKEAFQFAKWRLNPDRQGFISYRPDWMTEDLERVIEEATFR